MKVNDKLTKFEEWKNEWEKPNDLNWLSYISFNLHPEDVLILYKLYFPDFINIDGYIYLADRYDEKNYHIWFSKLNGENKSIQRIINHVHIYDLFANCLDDVNDDAFISLAKKLKKSWMLTLKEKYPNIDIEIDYSYTDEDYGPTLILYNN